MYEFVPAPGTKLSKISALSNDLAMSLQALRVRIVAPIPGKGSVGIEVPNKTRATVYLKEILVDEGVQKAKSKLTMGLGKDIAGAPVAVDLAKMPHLLVAGTTGSGKSVAVNGMICSILFNSTPEEVRMIMIDPKMVELSIYEGIPHLLLPVVTDPKKANLALRWAVDEMERRYELVSKAGVRDILAYNKKVEKILADGPPKIESKKIKIFVEGDGRREERGRGRRQRGRPCARRAASSTPRCATRSRRRIALPQKAREEAPPPPRKLPYIVVIIDEFADLMMVAPKDVETSVARIAQKARAVGIHLLLATQRPSVDVITGLIKANFPSRIAFQVASKIDSRTILDQQGAENLLGMGDMLFTDRGQALRRVHGALVTDVEIKRMVDFLKLQGQPVYDMDILKPRVDEEGEGGEGGRRRRRGRRPAVRPGGAPGVRDAHGVGVDDPAAAADRLQPRLAARRAHGARRHRRRAQRRQAARGARAGDLIELRWRPCARCARRTPASPTSPATPSRRTTSSVDGLRVHYLDEGPRDAPPVLLLHGEPSWSFLYRKMIPPLVAAGHRVVAPDLVGFGRSDKPSERGDYTYQRHVDWMAALPRRARSVAHDARVPGLGRAHRPAPRRRARATRFARVVAANTFLPTGDQDPGPAFLAWQKFSQETPVFDVGKIVVGRAARRRSLPRCVAAYDAPFPDETLQGGRAPVPAPGAGAPRRSGIGAEPRGVGVAARVGQAVPDRVLRLGPDHARRRPALAGAHPRLRRAVAHHHHRRRPLPAGGSRRGARRSRRRLHCAHARLTHLSQERG